MSLYNDNIPNRIHEALNYPLINRCPALGLLIDACSIRELQEVFPAIISSIFTSNGGIGWGLRTITRVAFPNEHEVMHSFFVPHGPMFRLCYRLLNDAIKFELPIDMLPPKLIDMIQNGHYSMFYADLVLIDAFRRCITSLSLNAFDYFILNFVIHGITPLHRMNSAALTVHNDKLKTLYFFLAADYLCAFLPGNPDDIVRPAVCSTVKVIQTVPVQPLQTVRQPKYLNLSPISHFSKNQTSPTRTPEIPRAYAWRSESVLYFFIDVWLGIDIEGTRVLPSTEFIRVVRILVKQLHSFGNSADLDNTSMACLRKQTNVMMKSRIYTLLKSLIARWPLDNSLSVVIELWLSYIQPWRYIYNRNLSFTNFDLSKSKYQTFIAENISIYTQIFILIFPRLERLDFTSKDNVQMLLRIVKVFQQSYLSDILKINEAKIRNNIEVSSLPHSSQKKSLYYSTNKTLDFSNEWESFRLDNYYSDDNYIFMFDDEMKNIVEKFIEKMYLTKYRLIQEYQSITFEVQNQGKSFWKKFSNYFIDNDPKHNRIQEIEKIANMIDISIINLSSIFNINPSDLEIENLTNENNNNETQANFSVNTDSDTSDLSFISPRKARQFIPTSEFNGDPALLPVEFYECTLLVRFLHQVSTKLNTMFFSKIQRLWNNNNISRKILSFILFPPMTVKHFDKTQGETIIQEEHLPARVCLRCLASYKNLALVAIILFFIKYFFGVPILTQILLIFLMFICLYIFVIAS